MNTFEHGNELWRSRKDKKLYISPFLRKLDAIWSSLTVLFFTSLCYIYSSRPQLCIMSNIRILESK
jgi:hypothetical protein